MNYKEYQKQRKGIMKQLDDEQIEQQIIDGEARYRFSVLHDEICDGCQDCNS